MSIGLFTRQRMLSSRYAYALANASPALPTVHLSSAVSHSEGDSGTTTFTYTVTRSDATGAVNVPWSFSAGSTSANDFVGGSYPSGGTVSMADGVASVTFSVSVQGDTTVEGDEAFTVSISAPSGYALGAPSSATGTILNDDSAPTPTVTISSAISQNEGDSGTTVYTYTVTRSDATGAVSVPWAFSAGTTSANDFVGGSYPAGGTVDMADGVASNTFSINVQGDTTVESDESFTVSLTAPAGYALGSPSSATGTILNDDTAASGYDVFVLAGQSNMIGRNGPIDPTLDATDADIYQWGYSAQALSIAADPLDHDGETANTVGMGLSFAKAYKAAGSLSSGRKILLIPVARGGQPISYWAPGGAGDTAVIASVNAAMAAGTGTNVLKGILWHQGESDSGRSQAAYASDLDTLVAHWRSSFTGGSSSTPFICGELLQGGASTDANIVAALADTPNRLGYAAFVNSDSLVGGGDNLHFTAASQRTFGGRYHSALATAQANEQTVPGAVSTLSGSAGNGQVVLSWTAPATGHSPITDYLVEYKTSAGSTWSTFADGLSAATGAVVTGLTNGTAYDFRVAPVNAIGQGAYSNVASQTPATTGITPEAGAARHFVFGDDNTSMADLVVGDVMTPVSGALTHSSGYTTTAGQNGGARSTKAVSTTQTIIMVARMRVSAMVGGSFGTTAGAGFYTSSSNVLSFATRGSSGRITRTMDNSLWYFIALSYENGVSRLDYIADPSSPYVNTGLLSAASVGTTNLVGIGDTYYDSASFAGTVDVAEQIIFDGTKTQSELEAILARSQTRLSARGITINA